MSQMKATNVNFNGSVYATLQIFLRRLNKGKEKNDQVSQSAYVSEAVRQRLERDKAV